METYNINATEKQDRQTEQDMLLIVDDDAVNRTILAKIFSSKYNIIEADNGSRGLAAFISNRERVCAVLLDVVMPGMDGIDVLRHLKDMGSLKNTPVFLITSERSDRLTETAYNLGVMDIIVKPVQPFIVQRRVESVIELFETRRELSDLVETQKIRLREQAEQIIKLNQGTIEALAAAIEFRNRETGGHIHRISNITRFVLESTRIGQSLSLDDIEHIAQASVLHDVGKILIPDAILTKPGKLTDEEFEIMKKHTVYGCSLLESIPQLKDTPIFDYACDIARHHHERWDGRGYPDGLKGDEITPWAQVASLADVYDALSCKRVYKDPLPRSEVLELIISGQCGQFNPLLLDDFFMVEPKIHEMYLSLAKEADPIVSF